MQNSAIYDSRIKTGLIAYTLYPLPGKEDFMLQLVTLSSDGHPPRTYKTYKIVRIKAHTFNNDFDNRRVKQ